MSLDALSPFDFNAGIVAVSQPSQPPMLPRESPSPPLLGESPVQSKLEELFQVCQLDSIEMDSMALPPETLQVLSREPLRSLISDLERLLMSAGGIAPLHEIDRVTEMLSEELMNHELLSAFRRAIVGG
ncbi:MAG: hypothetical protein ACH346_05055 [Chthoniobacterales bacterium]